MGRRAGTIDWFFAIAIAGASAAIGAEPPDATSEIETVPIAGTSMEEWDRTATALYDALVAESSPRTAVLTARVWLPESARAVPGALRPRSEDVVARAVALAPDDAFVQSVAASDGWYQPNFCGQSPWPDAEVGNLVRLEPDNAGAWRYAVALAHAKGDEADIDDTLSRMAAAPRADDHLVDEIAAWTDLFMREPALGEGAYAEYSEYTYGPADTAMLAAMEHLDTNANADPALKAVCTPDGSSERTWRRIGWCLDAGQRLATQGTSLALRESGVTMLEAVGDTSEAAANARRELDWLNANDANPVRHTLEDDPADMPAALADWHGASSGVAAIRRRLRRLGLPATPPDGWTKQRAEDEQEAKDNAASLAFADYLAAVFADLRASGAPHARVLAIANANYPAELRQMASVRAVPRESDELRAAHAEAVTNRKAEIGRIAAAHADDLRVQWAIARGSEAPEATRTHAIAAIQTTESDNAAAWAVSLETATSDASIDALLARMAAGTHFDLHQVDAMTALLAAMQRHAIPPTVQETGWWKPVRRMVSADEGAKYMAVVMAHVASGTTARVTDLCGVDTPAARRDACIAIGKLLVQKGLDRADVTIGEGILRRLKSNDPADVARVAHVRWWYEVKSRQEWHESVVAYLDDYLATGDEVAALKRNAERRGKVEPPANWHPPKSIGRD